MATLKKHINEFPVFGDVLADIFKEDIFSPSKLVVGKKIPAANILEDDLRFTIQLAIPGFNKDNFDILLNENVLTITSKKAGKKHELSADTNFTLKEFDYNSFTRSFNLPENADRSGITANYFDGILEVNITKLIPQIETPIRIKVS